MRTLLLVLLFFSTLTAFSDELPYITNERGDLLLQNNRANKRAKRKIYSY